MYGKDVTLPVALMENSDEMVLLESEITIENENWDDLNQMYLSYPAWMTSCWTEARR